MRSVWTRRGAGTGSDTPTASPSDVRVKVNRAPVPDLPQVHQIVLPTPWEADQVQIYLIDDDPLTLVDVGLDSAESWAALTTALEALGYGIEDVRRVLLTHYHRDHMGQAQALRDAGADFELWAHEEAAPLVERFSVEADERLDDTTHLFRLYGAPEDVLERMNAHRRERMRDDPALCRATSVERLLRHGDAVPFKGLALDIIHSPGHTAGDVLLHERDAGVLFTGDHLIGRAVPNTENYYVGELPEPGDPLHRRPRFKGLVRYRESLQALRGQGFRVILPAFGGVIRAPDRAIREALLYYDVRIQRIERSLRSVSAMGQAVTAYELWHGMFAGEDPVREMKTHLLMVIGALDVLEEKGVCLTRVREDGVLVHSLR